MFEEDNGTNKDNTFAIFPIIMKNEPSQYPRDLTIINQYIFGNGNSPFMPGLGMGDFRDRQMLEMNQSLLQVSALLLEQRRINETLLKASLQIGTKNAENIDQLQIENKEVISSGKVKGIDVDVEYVVDKEETTIKEEKNEMGTAKKQIRLSDITESISRQLKSDNEPPFSLEGKVSGTTEGKIIFAPVVFTVRNSIWRDRVRFVLKEIYGKNKSPSQTENNPTVIAILYNRNLNAVEIDAISQLSLKQYLDTEFMFNISKEDITVGGIRKIISILVKEFKIEVDYYYHTFEPVINSDTPAVITRKGRNYNFLGDPIKVKPVFSSVKKDQSYGLDTYADSVIKFDIQRL